MLSSGYGRHTMRVVEPSWPSILLRDREGRAQPFVGQDCSETNVWLSPGVKYYFLSATSVARAHRISRGLNSGSAPMRSQTCCQFTTIIKIPDKCNSLAAAYATRGPGLHVHGTCGHMRFEAYQVPTRCRLHAECDRAVSGCRQLGT